MHTRTAVLDGVGGCRRGREGRAYLWMWLVGETTDEAAVDRERKNPRKTPIFRTRVRESTKKRAIFSFDHRLIILTHIEERGRTLRKYRFAM